MELHFCFDFCCNHWQGKDICKVFRQVYRVYTFNFATSKCCKFAERLNIALCSLNRYDVDGDSMLLGELSNTLIKFFNLSYLNRRLGFIKSSKSNVCKSISANNNCATWVALASHCNRCQHSRAHRSRPRFLNTKNLF